MDPFTLIFVGGLCLVAFALTISVRRELIARERRRSEERRDSLHARARRRP